MSSRAVVFLLLAVVGFVVPGIPGAVAGDSSLPPVAVDDHYDMVIDGTLNASAPHTGVLVNDIGAEWYELTAELVDDVDVGSLTFHDDGSFNYAPPTGYLGDAVFTYIAVDSTNDTSAPATATISVNPRPNVVPRAWDAQFRTGPDEPLIVEAPGVLANISDSGYDVHTALLVNDVENGTLALDDDGSFTYTPDTGFQGEDSFRFRAVDSFGERSNIATAHLDVETIVPPPGDFSAGFEWGTWEDVWTSVNLSDIPYFDWQQGSRTSGISQQGKPQDYITNSFFSTGGSVISHWLISPLLGDLSDGDVYSFWTTAMVGSSFPDGLEFRLSTSGSCSPGSTPTSTGDFNVQLEDINTDLVVGGYPEEWTEFTAELSGMPEGASGCFAFRYLVYFDAGEYGSNSHSIAIDTFSYTRTDGEPREPTDEPTVPTEQTGASTTDLPDALDAVARSIMYSQLAFPEDGSGSNGARGPYAGQEEQTVLLGRDDLFADSLASGGAQGALDAPLLLTGSDGLDPRVALELNRLGATRVIMLGGEAALSEQVEDDLGTAYRVDRAEGATRLQTAVALADMVAVADESVAVLARAYADESGGDETQAFADSLAAGALAGESAAPLLLTQTEVLSEPTATWLDGTGITEVIVVGGEAAVSPAVADSLAAMDITVTRLDGANRAATAVAIAGERGADRAGEASASILVDGATADGWTDAFPAALLASRDLMPIVLATDDLVPPETAAYVMDGGTSLTCATLTSAAACDSATSLLGLDG